MSSWPGHSKDIKTTFGGLTRSALMSRIRSKRNATTELKLMSLLRSAGLSGWRRAYPLKGNPDFVFPKSKLAVFVDGCFWHGHDCKHNMIPKSNTDIWGKKITRNRSRDRRNTQKLRSAGWIVVRIWECDLVKHPSASTNRIRRILKAFSNSASS